jgi:hypothetical protein
MEVSFAVAEVSADGDSNQHKQGSSKSESSDGAKQGSDHKSPLCFSGRRPFQQHVSLHSPPQRITGLVAMV